MENEKVFVSYQDEDGNKTEGYFELLDMHIAYIKIKTNKQALILPWHKINKLKGGKL